MISCRALSDYEYPEIKQVKVYDGSNFINLSEFITYFITNNEESIKEDEIYYKDNIVCNKIEYESHDFYELFFENKPNLGFDIFYANKLEKVSAPGHDSLYCKINLSEFEEEDKELFIIIYDKESRNAFKEFKKSLNEIKENLSNILLTKGSLSFMDELITKAGIPKKKAYTEIAKACEEYINTNYIQK